MQLPMQDEVPNWLGGGQIMAESRVRLRCDVCVAAMQAFTEA
jgi:hypothetical protein